MLLSCALSSATSKSDRHRNPPEMPKETKMISTSSSSSSPYYSKEEGKIWSTIRRWPALTICISITSALFLLLFALAVAGWPGSSVTSNCYEDYLVTPDCFCEKLRGDKPGDYWIAQPMNTLTNLWFVLVGLLIAYAADSRKFPSEDLWNKNDNLITQDNIYAIVLALDACLLGVGSTFLHASFTAWGREADMSAMYLIATFMNIYPLLRERHISKEQAIWAYLLGNASLIYWVINLSTPEQARKVFTTLMLTSWVIEIFMIDREWAKKNQVARKIFFSNMFMFIGAVLQWKASESGGPLCYPESIFQGHSLWHFQSAVGIGGVFLYYVCEEEQIPLPPPEATAKSSKKKMVVENVHVATTKRTESPEAGAESVSSHSSISEDQSSTEEENSVAWSESESESMQGRAETDK